MILILLSGGFLLGLLFGLLSSFWMKKIANDEILIVNITIVSCYLVYTFLKLEFLKKNVKSYFCS
jgi:hypothetical protein